MGLKAKKLIFSAKEAESLTGVGSFQQRNYRRHGYLPPKHDAKWTRYDLHEVALLLVIGRLSDIGVKPATGGAIAKLAAPHVCTFAAAKYLSLGSPTEPKPATPSCPPLIVFTHQQCVLRHELLLDSATTRSGYNAGAAVAIALDIKLLGEQLLAGVLRLQRLPKASIRSP